MTENQNQFDVVTRKTVKQVSHASEEVSSKLWFLDLKFETFATPSLIGFAFLAWMFLCLLIFAATAFYGLLNYPALQAIVGIIVTAVGLLLSTILVRVFFESLLIAFRIAEHLKSIAASAKTLTEHRLN